MSFWRREVIDFALDRETRAHIEEQRAWIAREPANARPYYNLAQLYRIEGRHDEALALLLEASALDSAFPDPHISLVEIYAVREDYASAWKHARAAEQAGDSRGTELLRRYGIPEP